MSFLLASAARATTGARSGQEDAFRLWPAEGVAQPSGDDGGLLAVLADGMGGHTGGAIAGQTACSTFAEVFASAAIPYDQRLEPALNASNEALAKGVEKNAALRGMGCTLVAAWMDTLGIRWTSVGDSLLLLYRFPDVIRLNADHSLGSFLDEQVRQNRITATEAKQHHNRNALRSALTGSKIDLIDLRNEPLELRAGDWILLASDGICSLNGDEIADVVYNYRQSTPAEMAEGLIDAVVQKGVAGQDNTTVVTVRVDQAPEAAADASTTRVVMRAGSDEEVLRSRRIGVTGRKPAPPRRVAGRSLRSVAWWVAAAVFFLFFAVTVLLRSLTSSSPPSIEAKKRAAREPVAITTPEPATPDTPDTAAPDTPRAPAPPAAQPPPPAPKSATPDAAQSPPGFAAPKPPAPQRASPVRPPQVAPSDAQPTTPSPSPSTQSSETQQEQSSRAAKVKLRKEREQARRLKRQEQQLRDATKEALKAAPKDVTKDVFKEAPKTAPKASVPWGFGSE